MNPQFPLTHILRLEHQYHNRILHRTRAPHPLTPRIQLRPHGPHVLPYGAQHLRVRLQHIQHLARRGRQHRRQRRAECVRCRGDALVFDDFLGAGAEAAAGAERARERADDHVDFGGVDVLVLGDPAARAAEDAEGPGFVQDEAEFVFEFELDLSNGKRVSLSWGWDGRMGRNVRF